MPLYMVFDVESIGLHGEGFQVGYVVVDATGEEFESGRYDGDPDEALGEDEDREWVTQHVKTQGPIVPLDVVHSMFWAKWQVWKDRGATLWSDCVWPVESNFLTACVDYDDRRKWEGPYPCYDVMTLRLAAGFDPHERCERLADELPEHDALNDARQSARLLIEALRKLGQV